jgi:hypothetical protein
VPSLADLDIEELEGLAGKAMDVALNRMGIRLDKRRQSDLREYLVELGLRMAKTYDPSVGQAFSTWYYRRARMRVVDWLRSTHGDSRYGMALAKLEVSYPSVSLGHIDAESFDRWTPVVEDPDPGSLADAIVELGQASQRMRAGRS